MKIAIIGDGNVGSALLRGLKHVGHDVRAVGNDPEQVRRLAQAAPVIILAVPYGALDDVLREIGAADGKVLVDTTNPIAPGFQLALGFTTSGAEELQRKVPNARVVKAFNTMFAAHMDTGRIKGQPLASLVAGDDADARQTVLDLAASIGFDAIDAGPLRNARYLEPMALQIISLGYGLGMGADIGYKLVR
ncbi:MAG: NADP oxidoreductase [Gemmatimonadetes bacterium]|nr:NADP oxidoreductase [Gemmatimonadota bacterium]